MARAKEILVSSTSNGGFSLHEENIKSILLADDVRDKPVILISVAGAFRKGKSFLLNMMIRYLMAANKEDWINTKPSDIAGFPWQAGYKRHTTGILMWSKPFPVTLPSGEEAVILLMDTQGTFDNMSTMHESATVFALSTLLSSLQIFNLMGNLQSDDLEHLQLFTEYGKMVLDDNNEKPFQKIMFLIRDWQYHDVPLGEKGGQELVEEWLQNKSGKKELAKVREHIRDCFTEIKGFLLPHPGEKVACSPQFNGSASDMEPKFVEGLMNLMPTILSPRNLTVKTIAGNQLMARDLMTYMETYFNLFKSDKIPKPKNILAATAEANNMAAVDEAKTQYINQMQAVLGVDKPSLDPNELFRQHKEAALQAEKAFKGRKKMGDWKTSEGFLVQLLAYIENWFQFAEQANGTKREKERLNAENHNLTLVSACKAVYVQEMKTVAGGEVGHVPTLQMDEAHGVAKQRAMEKFDADKADFDGVAGHSRFSLLEAIDGEFKQMFFHNETKKDAKNQKSAQANMKAVGRAKSTYQSMMNTVTARQSLTSNVLGNIHQEALGAALDVFDSLKEGDEDICVGYLENLRSDLDRDFNTYAMANNSKVQMERTQKETEELRRLLELSKNQPPRVVTQPAPCAIL